MDALLGVAEASSWVQYCRMASNPVVNSVSCCRAGGGRVVSDVVAAAVSAAAMLEDT